MLIKAVEGHYQIIGNDLLACGPLPQYDPEQAQNCGLCNWCRNADVRMNSDLQCDGSPGMDERQVGSKISPSADRRLEHSSAMTRSHRIEGATVEKNATP